MSDENLYKIVKDKLCSRIYDGTYDEGERIPPERELASQLNVSRVTIRRALVELEEEELILWEVGRGTRVTFHNYGYPDELDMIVLIAPARNPFFSRFIEQFQSSAERNGALLLYVEKPGAETLEDCLYRLYRRGLRNVTAWLEDMQIDRKKLKRLRALGMNMVFFDSDKGMPYADCVTLDNRRAVGALYGELKKCGYKSIEYVGWDDQDMYSAREREAAYVERSGNRGVFLRIPWEERRSCETYLRQEFKRHVPEALICSDWEIGEAVIRVVKSLRLSVRIATVDEVPKKQKGDAISYCQDIERMTEQIIACLKKQCRDSRSWSPKLYQIEGILRNVM